MAKPKKRYRDDEEENDPPGFWVDDEYYELTRWPEASPLSYWQPKAVDWLWEPYVPAGAITFLSGATAGGKTYLALAIAAAVAPAREGENVAAGATAATAGVLYLTMGNDPEQVLRPRFDKLGGNADRLHVIRGFMPLDEERREYGALAPREITDALPGLIKAHNIRLLILDPFETYLGTGKGRHAQPTMERVELLSRLAEDMRCGVLLIGSAKPPAALATVARSELAAGILPGTAERVLVQVKSNVGPLGPALRFAIEEDDKFCWRGESGLSDGGLLFPEPDAEKRVALREAMEFLRIELAAGPVPALKLLREAHEQGISETTLRRAKLRLGVGSHKDGQLRWNWYLSGPSLALPAADPGPVAGSQEPPSDLARKSNDRLDCLDCLQDSIALNATA
jgi:AAA domain